MSGRLPPIEAISFDLFETLVDSEIGRLPLVEWNGRRMPSTAGVLHDHVASRHPVDLETFLSTMQEVERDLGRSRRKAGREFPNAERFAAVVARLSVEDPELASELGELHMGMIRAHTKVPEHHAALLERLRSRFRIAVCSNFNHSPTALRILEAGALHPHLDVIVISEEVDVRKPARGIFDALSERLGLEPGRILHVGDQLVADVAGAAAVGMRTAWITRGVRDRDAARAAFEGPSPDLEIRDLAELERLLD